MQWKCDVCGRKKLKFIKKQEARGLSSLCLKTPLTKVPC